MRRQFVLPLLALATACASSDTTVEIVPLRVDKVDVLVLESFPPMVHAVVTGTLPTACSSIESVSQRREGNLIEVTITAQTAREVICIQVIKEVTERVRLDGAFPPGQYILRVNGVESRFQV